MKVKIATAEVTKVEGRKENTYFFIFSDNYGCSTCCYHEHRAISTDNGFTCHNTFVLADGVTFNLWGSLQSKARDMVIMARNLNSPLVLQSETKRVRTLNIS